MTTRGAKTGRSAATGGAPDASASATAHEGVLAELIEVEQRVDAAIRAAEEQAERAIAAAEAEARERDDAHDDVLAVALRELESSLERERSETLAEIARRSEEAVRLHRAVDDARVRRLAEFVAARIAEGELEPGGGRSSGSDS